MSRDRLTGLDLLHDLLPCDDAHWNFNRSIARRDSGALRHVLQLVVSGNLLFLERRANGEIGW